MPNGYTCDDAHDALNYLDAGVDRETWHMIGRSAIAAGLTIDQIDTWSATGDNYSGTQDVIAAFKTITPEGGTGPGTLFRLAIDAGWVSPLKQNQGDQSPTKAKPARTTKPVEPPRKPAPGKGASEVYDRCQPATNQHPYISAKRAAGVPLDDLRVVPDGDPLRIMGESMAGALVVPCMAMDGTLSTLQLIPPPDVAARLKAKDKPGKLNLPGHPVNGWFTVGTITPGGVVYIVEGIGQAWACWQATGAAAVACFGAGNMGKVAHALRQQDDTARLVVVPDVGMEDAAAKIAAAVAGMVAAMPGGWPKNSDVNDLAQRDGLDVLALLLEAATEPPKPEPKIHPLAKFVDIDGTAKPPRWVIPGFIGHGVTVIAGAHGVGKTTALLPLALTAAGLHGDELLPRQWRHVVYVTEDVEQARRILAGLTLHSNLGVDLSVVRERVHIVEAIRLDPAFVATVGKTYREQFTRTVEGVEVLPLVVLDTKSAVLALDNENDNSEASSMMAALKQGFEGLPVWLIGHVAKPNLNRSEVSGLTSRGASAVEGDANQTMFLVREGESRFLVLGKRRFEPKWEELEITSYTAQAPALDEFGNVEAVVMRWGIAAPAQQSRKEAAEQAAEQQRKEDDASLRQDIRDAVEVAWVTGNPLNREGIKAKLNRKAQTVQATIENLLTERWLHEVFIPAKERLHPRKSSFFINLTTDEHEAVLSGAGLPDDKLVVPESWKKPAVSIIPAPDDDAMEFVA